jgi:hypothetical protein
MFFARSIPWKIASLANCRDCNGVKLANGLNIPVDSGCGGNLCIGDSTRSPPVEKEMFSFVKLSVIL